MKFSLITAIALVAAVTFFAGQAVGGDEDPHKGHSHAEGEGHEGQGKEQAEMDPKMMAWMKYAMPGEHHAHLKPLEGKWNLAVSYRMDPEKEFETEASTAQSRWILGGRFLMSEITGEEFMGQRFEGLSILGYDNYAKTYTSSWRDTMMTMTMMATGTCDNSGKEFTFTGEYDDVASGKTKKVKSVIRIINENKYTWEGFDTANDGKEYKSMSITYTRA